MLRRRTLSLVIILAVGPAMAEELQLEELMKTLSRNSQQSATFVEKRYLRVLNEPLESSGELSFVPPNHLEKRTFKPKTESVIVDGDILTVARSGPNALHYRLQEHPEISAFVESIRGTLAGDQTALEKVYQLTLSGSFERWRLLLVPRQKELARIVSRIGISGSHSELTTIEFDFEDGDHAEMTIAAVQGQ